MLLSSLFDYWLADTNNDCYYTVFNIGRMNMMWYDKLALALTSLILYVILIIIDRLLLFYFLFLFYLYYFIIYYIILLFVIYLLIVE